MELIDDAIAEILLRLPPDKPAALFCKGWLRDTTNPTFLHLYRTFHQGAAPLLGFFYNIKSESHPRFVSTVATSPLPPAYKHRRTTRALDCRHGRVLLRRKCSRDLVVWNPITDHWYDLRQKPKGIRYGSYSAVVICAVAGCDHRNCSGDGGPFLVVCVGNNVEGNGIHACTYSSKDCAWGKLDTFCLTRRPDIGQKRAAIIGDGMYMYCSFVSGCSSIILKYDIVKGRFSIIRMPYTSFLYKEEEPVLMQNDDGSLGLAHVSCSRLEIWSANVNIEGMAPWVQQRDFYLKLRAVWPWPTNKPSIEAKVTGFAEGVGILFISTSVALGRNKNTAVTAYTLGLKSCRLSRVKGPSKSCAVFPFISFLTTDCGRGKLLSPVNTNY